MPLTPAQLPALKTELTTDPRGYGYAADITVGNVEALTRKLNLTRDGSTGTVPTNPTAGGGLASGIIRMNNESTDTGKIRAAVTFAGFNGLVTATQDWFVWLTSNGYVTVNAHLLQQLAGIPTATSAIWAAADRTAMNAAMESILRKFASRADELFATSVTEDNVSKALLLP